MKLEWVFPPVPPPGARLLQRIRKEEPLWPTLWYQHNRFAGRIKPLRPVVFDEPSAAVMVCRIWIADYRLPWGLHDANRYTTVNLPGTYVGHRVAMKTLEDYIAEHPEIHPNFEKLGDVDD